MYLVYVLESEADGKLYVGCTSDIQERLETHNRGLVSSTKGRRPFKLIYTEKFEDKYEAFRVERFYKTAVGKRQLKKKIQHSGIV